MMISLTNLLLAVNTVILIVGAIVYFKKNYVVVDSETWSAVAECVEEYNSMVEQSQELAGGEGYGTGFFREALNEEEEEEE